MEIIIKNTPHIEAIRKSCYNKIENAQILAMGASEFKYLESLPAVPIEISQITELLWTSKAFMNQEFTVKNLQIERPGLDQLLWTLMVFP